MNEKYCLRSRDTFEERREGGGTEGESASTSPRPFLTAAVLSTNGTNEAAAADIVFYSRKSNIAGGRRGQLVVSAARSNAWAFQVQERHSNLSLELQAISRAIFSSWPASPP